MSKIWFTFIICEFSTRPCNPNFLCLALCKPWRCFTLSDWQFSTRGEKPDLGIAPEFDGSIPKVAWQNDGLMGSMVWLVCVCACEAVNEQHYLLASLCKHWWLFSVSACAAAWGREVPQLPTLLRWSWSYPWTFGSKVFCCSKCLGPVQHTSVPQGLNWTKVWPHIWCWLPQGYKYC